MTTRRKLAEAALALALELNLPKKQRKQVRTALTVGLRGGATDNLEADRWATETARSLVKLARERLSAWRGFTAWGQQVRKRIEWRTTELERVLARLDAVCAIRLNGRCPGCGDPTAGGKPCDDCWDEAVSNPPGVLDYLPWSNSH